jgi:hypothetical protein
VTSGEHPSGETSFRTDGLDMQVLVDRRADVGVAGRAQIFDPTE